MTDIVGINNLTHLKALAMITTHYKLGDTQYIGDLDIKVNPDHYVIHFSADTGLGKSSWIIENLTQHHRIIFAVPQRAQITQLQSNYSERTDIDFIYGGHSQLSDCPLHIVCTYDQLASLKGKLRTQNYMLVVDEVHKLYQAAGYREEAVLTLVDAIKDKWFQQVLTLSATFTSSLVPYQIDAWLEVSRSVPIERHVEFEVFEDVESMEFVLMNSFKRTKYGPTVMRLNNKEAMSAYKQVLEGKNLRCLAVNSDRQSDPEVVKMLKNESIAEYDVVLTTSLLDEAININDEIISELIIFNSRIHPEELKQFIGRFRLYNPKVRICLPKNRLSGKTIDLDSIQKRTLSAAHSAKTLAEAACGDLNPVEAVQKTNQTLKELIGFEPLRFKQSSIIINEASIMARLFKADIDQCYQNENSLKDRLGNIFKALDFQVRHINQSGGRSPFSAYLASAFSDQEASREELLASCRGKVMDEICLRPISAKSHRDTVDVLDVVYRSIDKSSAEKVIIKCWRDLHQHVLMNMWQAYDAIRLQQEKRIWQFHEAVESSFYVQPLLLSLQQLPKGTQMTLAEAREKILETLRQVATKYPLFKDLVATSSVKGVSVKRNNHFSVTDKFVRSIFRDYTVTAPIRSNNKDKIVFDGVGLFGYDYQLKENNKNVTKTRKAVRRIRKIKIAA